MLARIITENGVKKIQPLTADVGAGAPVGSLAMMYKKSAPSGYLYCDGSTFNAATYPALYAYLGSNTLPDYREFAPVGAEQNTTDTIAAHDVYAQGEGKDDQLQGHFHSPVSFYYGSTKMYINNSNAGVASGSGGAMDYTSNRNNTNSVVENPSTDGINGTPRTGNVTRGKRKAVYFYIKATSGLAENQQENVLATINENNSYSTTEKPTGAKWIDGKPIYRKVVDCGALPNATSKSVAHNITNLDQVTKLQGIAKGTNQIPLPFMDISTPTNGVQLYYTAASIVVQTGGNRTAYTNTYIIIEYTKTTD